MASCFSREGTWSRHKYLDLSYTFECVFSTLKLILYLGYRAGQIFTSLQSMLVLSGILVMQILHMLQVYAVLPAGPASNKACITRTVIVYSFRGAQADCKKPTSNPDQARGFGGGL